MEAEIDAQLKLCDLIDAKLQNVSPIVNPSTVSQENQAFLKQISLKIDLA